MELDHVLVAVRDLEAAGNRFARRHGLTSVEGGRHPGWGTANRIVPLGDAYLELVAVVEPEVARHSSFGRCIAAASSSEGALVGWAVRVEGLDGIAERLGLGVEAGSRTRSDGSELRWTLAGLEEALAEPSLPFFIQWAPGSVLPGRAAGSTSGRIARITVSGSAERLSSWLGITDIAVTVVAGDPSVRSVRIATVEGSSVVVGN